MMGNNGIQTTDTPGIIITGNIIINNAVCGCCDMRLDIPKNWHSVKVSLSAEEMEAERERKRSL